MLVHCAYYWLNEGVTREERLDFEKALRLVTTIPSVHAFMGAPAPPVRPGEPGLDGSFNHALVLAFADVAAFEDFQRHPAHAAFRDTAARLCARVQLYDFQDR